jgi:3-hydroxyisobutyrate dehydrogenase-like beta-hydroxyacid dehydrogenase
MTTLAGIGFIGLGVMGEPMCRNIAIKSGAAVAAFDLTSPPLRRLAEHGVRAAGSLADLARTSDLVLMSLPSGKEVEAVCTGPGGLVELARPGQTIVDLGTSPPALARSLSAALAAKGADFADAPIARTRQAAEDGTLSIMVGADPAVFARIQPVLTCCGSEVTHCGGVGAGQVVKILNNMVLSETVVALSEAAAIAEAQGVDRKLLFETLSKGSADSFALRNHGLKAIIPGAFPEWAFSAAYMLKDVAYALEMAGEGAVPAAGAQTAHRLLGAAITAGKGDAYWPVIATLLRKPAAD